MDVQVALNQIVVYGNGWDLFCQETTVANLSMSVLRIHMMLSKQSLTELAFACSAQDPE